MDDLSCSRRDANDVLSVARALFDQAAGLIAERNGFAAIRTLGPQLTELRDLAIGLGLGGRFLEAARQHELFELCQQDPYTARAYHKPRGYAGDAVMLDYVYSGNPPEGTSAIGSQIFHATTRVPMGLSVLYRRARLQAHINDVIARKPACRILSVASGHCREIEDSLLFRQVSDCEFYALDQDREAGATVASQYVHPHLHIVTAPIKALVSGRIDLGDFDFIYSAGLYDYLPGPIAARLTHRLFAMLRPAGQLLTANFLRTCYGRGYLEAFMDWQLVYRTAEELRELFPEAARNDVRVSLDPHGNVAYALATRAN